MKRFIGGVVFIAFGLLLFAEISDVLREKSAGASDSIHSFYEVEEDTIDVLCVGSSLGYSSFQPNTLWNEYGYTSYVLCSMKQSLPTSYYLLQEALNYQRPKVVFLEAYYFFCDKKYYDEPALRNAMDGMKLGKVKHQMIQDMLAESSWKDKLSYYIPFLKYHGRWSELKDTDFHSKNYLKGSVFSLKTYPMEEHRLPEEGCEIPELALEYFEKIVELCKEHDIKLIVYSVPYGYNDDMKELYEYTKKITVTVEGYLSKRGIDFISFWDADVAGIDWSTDYRDFAHYNTRGAMKVTRVLGDYLQSVCVLPDHRQDEAYGSWQQDFEKFKNDL